MKIFLKKNKNKKIVILDIPLLLENKINKKGDVLVYVDADQKKIKKGLKERKNYNNEIYKRFKKIQLSVERKKRKSTFIVKNNFKPNSVKKSVKNILRKILLYA